MRFALVNNDKTEASPRQKGLCAVCANPVTAKCGKQRIWHWAHDAKMVCDRWWETETEWHRAWKNHFPRECQESVLHDEQSGEKHIADVRTSLGLVIEFQHSHLDPQERDSRERVYGNMVWVVDGTRLKRDYPRFQNGKRDFRSAQLRGFYRVFFPDECFPAAWVNSKVPVVFDFRGVASDEPPDATREALWCLLPGRTDRFALVAAISRDQFVEHTRNQAHLFPQPAPAPAPPAVPVAQGIPNRLSFRPLGRRHFRL